MLSFLEKSASRRILGYILIFILVSIPPLTNRVSQTKKKKQFIIILNLDIRTVFTKTQFCIVCASFSF